VIVEGKNINLRGVEVSDAQFIYDLRQDEMKTKYLSQVSGTVDNQIQWIKKYKKREQEKKEFYFVIESKTKESLGLVRVYDFKDDSFCWGSWLIKDDAPNFTAIESALLIYEFAFYPLAFKKSHFDVRKENEKVVAFHKRFGARIVDENEIDYFFDFSKEEYEKTKLKYKKFLKQ